jgi:hypothetical protein
MGSDRISAIRAIRSSLRIAVIATREMDRKEPYTQGKAVFEGLTSQEGAFMNKPISHILDGLYAAKDKAHLAVVGKSPYNSLDSAISQINTTLDQFGNGLDDMIIRTPIKL